MEKKLLRKVQLRQLEIAKEIRRVCKLLNINYFLDSGTLLGAIRHDGFIPWDDDFDMGMLRVDYERFLKEAPAVLDKKYFLQTWYSDERYGLAFAKVREKDTVYMEESAVDTGTYNGFFVDIFPYDNYPDDLKKQKWQGKRYEFYKRTMLMKCGYKPYNIGKNAVERLRKKFIYLPMRMMAFFMKRQTLIQCYENMGQAFNEERTKCYYAQCGAAKYGKWVIDKRCFTSYEEHVFEGELFCVPGDSHSYLKSVYGDYMKLPPESERENRHRIIEVKF